jgi:tetratricopeptide (TPR) repeat protein
MKTKLIVLVIGLVIDLAAFQITSSAQGGKPGGMAPASNPGPSTTPGDPSKYLNRDWNTLVRSGRVGDYLVGNVTLLGGALPWDPIPVTVTCEGKARFTTSTDAKGNFMITPAQPAGSTTSKADAKPLAAQFVGCGVDAALPGFDSSPLTIANRNVLDSPNLGTITLRREEGASVAGLRSTTAAAPKDAAKSFDKARNEWLENKPDRAQKDLQKAVEIYPQFAEAWYQMGKIQEAMNNSREASNSFSKAVAADPKFALPYEHLAALAVRAENWQELVDDTNRELELNPRGTLDAWYYNALGNYQIKNLAVAEKSAMKSLSMDPLHILPDTEQMLAVILAQKGDVAGALQHLRNCLTYFPPGPNLELVKHQIAQLEPAVTPPK